MFASNWSNLLRKTIPFIALILILSLVLSGCQSMPQSMSSEGDDSYASNCLKGSLLGIGAGMVKEAMSGGNIFNPKTMAISAVAGCTVGLASTAVGKALNEREAALQDKAFQETAQAGAIQIAKSQVEPTSSTTPATTADKIETSSKDSEVKSTSVESEWSDGGTKGKAIFIGPSTEQVASADGKTSNCVKVREIAVKDGKEVTQLSTACQNDQGIWQRVGVETA